MRGDCFEPGLPPPKSLFDPPAMWALSIQALAFALAVVITIGLTTVLEMNIAVMAAAILQGAIAAVLSRWWQLAPWWLAIQFLFPVGLVALHALHLPPVLFLLAFIIFAALYWTTFRTQVPFYPSSPAVWDAVSELLPADRGICFIDIGSGFGGLVLRLAAQRPESNFTGIELAPLPWLASLLRTRLQRSRGHFVYGDYNSLDFAQFDAVFAYLSPAAMPALWEKAKSEMRPGSLLLSYEFLIPSMEPQITHTCSSSGKLLHGWRM